MRITRKMLSLQLKAMLVANAPVRTNPPTGRHGASPYPGNLKNNAFTLREYGDIASIEIGNNAVPYAVYTEYTSYKKGWIAKSSNDFLAMCRAYGGRIR